MNETVKIKVEREGITRDPEKLTQKLYEGTGLVLEKASQIARKKAPKRTGRLAREEGGIVWKAEKQGNKVIGEISATALNPTTGQDYAGLVHQGTGLWGEHETRIVPKTKACLVFTGKDGELVFAKSVKGQPPNPYLENGLTEAWKDADVIFRSKVDELNNLVS